MAFEGFRRTVAVVEQAKSALAAAAPTGRSAGASLAEALGAFEAGMRMAVAMMPSWRTAELEDRWAACLAALETAAGDAERVRLHAAPEGYEGLYGTLADLMGPLDAAFTAAADRFRRLGA